MFRRLSRVVMVAGLALGLSGLVVAPASAVTFGTAIERPSVSAPWVVSLYWSQTAAGNPEFICTASALSAQDVLTAAHCVQSPGFYYIKVGADRLSGGRLIPAEAVTDNTGYGARALVNDVAVLRTIYSLGLRAYPRLATPTMLRALAGPRPAALTLFGWGDNQNGRLTGSLAYTRLAPQTRAAQKTYGAMFRPALMLAAGRLIPSTNTYSGACNGDSGGPLVLTVGGSPFLAGITSFGVGGCNAKAPTVFTSVAAYNGWIAVARRGLPQRALTENRALPILQKPVSISGAVALGATLTCTPGEWSSNTRAVAVTWARSSKTSSSVTVLTTGVTYVVTAADAGSVINCVAVATSTAGRASAVSSVDAIRAPSTFASTVIAGVPKYAAPSELLGLTATCVAPAYEPPDVVLTYTWSMESNSVRTEVATGPTYTFNEGSLRALAGKSLVCVARATNAMGTHATSDSVTITALRAPAINATISYAPGGSVATEGAVSTCAVTGTTTATMTYRWGIQNNAPIAPDVLDPATTVLGTASTYAFTAADVAAVKGHYLVCEAVGTTWQGSTTKLGWQYFSTT